METARREEESAARTSVHRRIVWISVLMAFGLYLTRVSVGEIVKTDSFLNDPQIVADARTRFSVEVTGAQAPERLATWLETQTQSKMRFPMVLADGLDRQKAQQQLEALEAEGGEGRIRISKSQIGDVLGAFFFTYALFQVPAGWICDRLGARRGLASYIFFWSLLTAATAWVGSLPGLLAARLGFGVAQAGAYPASNAIVRRWFPLQTRGRASGLIAFGGRLGGTVAPFLTMWLILNTGGWRSVMLLYGAIGLAIAAAYYTIVRDRPSEHPRCNDAERQWIGQLPDDRKPQLSEVASMVGTYCLSRSLWLNSLGQFCVNIGWAFLITWLPTYLKEVHRVPEQRGAMMVTLVLASGMLGQLLGGRATDWSVRRFGLRLGRVLPIAGAYFVAGTAYLICPWIDSVWGILACCAVVSLMTDLGNPSIWAFMQDVGGRNTGSIFGWANMWGNFGAAVSAKLVPLLMVYGASQGMGQNLVFLTCAAAFFVAGLAALGMDATRPLQPSLRRTSGSSPTSPVQN